MDSSDYNMWLALSKGAGMLGMEVDAEAWLEVETMERVEVAEVGKE